MSAPEGRAPAAASFAALGVSTPLVHGLAKLAIAAPTAAQALAIPAIAKGASVAFVAPTGTGKTLAYLLPLLAGIETGKKAAQAIVLAPTPELAIQVQRVANALAQHADVPVRTVLLIGGTALDRQADKLKARPHVAIGTPGRVREMLGRLGPAEVRLLVLDESDRLLTGESLAAVRAVRQALGPDAQLVGVSATKQDDADAAFLALAPGAAILTAEAEAVNPDIRHLYLECDARDRVELLRKLLRVLQPPRALVFCADDRLAERATQELDYWQMPVAELHPDFSKLDRKQAMDDFRSGRALVLVTSDLAARGLDFPELTHVFQLDAPMQPRAYLHRAGRTGRAGRAGDSITFVTHDQLRLLRRYENDLGVTLHRGRLKNGRFVVASAGRDSDD